MYQVSEERFEELVDDALDAIPAHFARQLTNVAVLVRPYNEEEPSLLFLYVGVPLTERTFDHTGFLPDAIFIYRDTLEAMCHSEEQLAHEVKVTVFHEVGHYFGMSEEQLHALGWG